MTDTLNKNPESCTVCDTPETDVEASNGSLCDQCVPIDFAHKLCRERDEARFDLAFRRDLYRLQEERVQELEAEVKLWKENATSNRDVFDEMSKELDEARFDLSFSRDLYKLHEFQLDELRKQLAEAVSSCNIWQKGHSALVEDRNKTVLDCHQQTNKIAAEREGWKKIAVEQEKQIAKQLTILQENGLAEYGN